MKKHNNTTPENIIFYKTPCFLIYDSPEFKEYPTHWHNAVEILMPTENVFPVVCGGKDYILKENHILIIPPGELHNLKAQKGRRIIMLCDNTLLNDNPALRELYTILSEPLWINENYEDYFRESLKNIILEMVNIFETSPPFCETLLYQKFITLLLKIAEYKKGGENQEKKGVSDKTELFRKYIDSSYMNQISLASLADAVGYSKYHISRILSNNGLSFSDMLNARRIKAAETMLRNSNFSVTQIAFSVGFTSITTFNRAFKKIKNCTPTEFKEMYREKNV